MFTYRQYRRYRRWQRRRRLIAVLAVVVIVAVLSARQHTRTPPGHLGRSAPATGLPSGTARTRGAGRPPAITAAGRLAAAGTGLTWQSFHGIELPSSRHDGPHHARAGLAWGFSDTPRGALVAAVNIAVRTAALWGPRVFAATDYRQVTGPDTRALLRADFREYAALLAAAHARPGGPVGRGYATEAAYRFIGFSPAAATVDVVSEGPTGSGANVMAATQIQLVWRHGDWRVVAPPGGDWAASATRVTSLAGYTSFGNGG
jgi:hypothetical protein